ncbi:hypothetical protein VNO78_21139 [Psophocarpus tetragonolobus]|uniref:Uncharacterized protein n=1 Tax=Psophocarpus tetragonolobus TaxID=3891 RepID=A0AAN9RLT1_PSOTE
MPLSSFAGLRPAETIDSQAEKAIDGRIGTGTRAILGPTKPCHEQSTQQEQGIFKLRLIPSIALPSSNRLNCIVYSPSKLAADSTSPRVYALFVLASAIERE